MKSLLNYPQLIHKPFYFLRHGETDWNKSHTVMGQTDIPLNQNGLQQAHQVSFDGVDKPPETIFSSPLLRAQQTADIVNKSLNTTIVIEKDLQQSYWGNLEGLCKILPIDIRSKEALAFWIKATNVYKAEHPQDFINRTIKALNNCLQSTPELPHLPSQGR